MIVSCRGLGAAVTTVLLLLLEGARGQDLGARQATAADSSATYFETTWTPFTSPYTFGVPFEVGYTVSSTADAIRNQGALAWVLLYTTQTSGAPTAENIYSVLAPQYTCDAGENGQCSYEVGKTGSANLTLELNTGASNLPVKGESLQNFFFCLATDLEAKQVALTCETYSPFFNIGTGSGSRKRQAEALTPPTGVIRVIQNTNIVLKFGDPIPSPTPTPTPTPSAQPSSILIDPVPTITSFQTTERTPTAVATVSITPSSTETPPAASPSKSRSSLPAGAIAGIAVGAFLVLLVAILVGFFCIRRNRRLRNQSQTEQVLLTHNMRSVSRDMLGSEKDGSEGPMLAGTLETRPSSGGPYSHLSSSAPYSGPIGRPRTLSSPQPMADVAASGFPATNNLTPQRHATSATQNTAISARTEVSRGSTVRGGDMYDEPYHDVPVYGDARHLPQVYNTQSSSLQSPFLSSEPGMTDDELSRLEEEESERRIDAAIAEAERERQRRR